MMAERQKGTVKWFNGTKGFGFITPDNGGDDLFVHQSSIHSEGYRTLAEGEKVGFSVAEGNDGRTKAVDVTGPDGGPVQGGGGGGGGGRRDGFCGGRRDGGYGGGGACYSCGETGHMARDCPNSYQRGGGGGGGCYSCGETGHFARECPNSK